MFFFIYLQVRVSLHKLCARAVLTVWFVCKHTRVSLHVHLCERVNALVGLQWPGSSEPDMGAAIYTGWEGALRIMGMGALRTQIAGTGRPESL